MSGSKTSHPTIQAAKVEPRYVEGISGCVRDTKVQASLRRGSLWMNEEARTTSRWPEFLALSDEI